MRYALFFVTFVVFFAQTGDFSTRGRKSAVFSISLKRNVSLDISRRKSMHSAEDYLGKISTINVAVVDFAASYQPQDRTFGVDHSGPACSLAKLQMLNDVRGWPR